MEAVKNFLWRLLVAAAVIIFYFAAASCVPDKAPAVPVSDIAAVPVSDIAAVPVSDIAAEPVSDIAAEPVTEQDAAEAMPIARGIYPDLPYEPTNEDLEAAR